MKRFLTVYEFELKSYMKNKSFVITTIVLAVLLFGAMFLPRVFDMSDMLGIESTKTEDGKQDTEDKNKEDATKLGLVDKEGLFADLSTLEQAFGDNVNIVKLDSVKKLEKAVKKEEITAGFDVKDDLHYEYYVLNREMFDENQAVFEEVLSMVHQQRFCAEQGIDYASFMAEYNAPVDCTEQILGK
ncbi:MAG: hypothetical protein PUC55_06545, partial [Lachnospiraceae bacterium]|nr:hypothetical protein [Lachnospiraceae bacterium]